MVESFLGWPVMIETDNEETIDGGEHKCRTT